MLKYFYEGGPLFMGILTIVLLAGIVVFVLALVKQLSDQELLNKKETIKSIGLFGLVTGILGQFIGLFSAFEAISQAMEISPQIIAGGLKVSSITSIYGMLIFLILYLCAFILMATQKNVSQDNS